MGAALYLLGVSVLALNLGRWMLLSRMGLTLAILPGPLVGFLAFFPMVRSGSPFRGRMAGSAVLCLAGIVLCLVGEDLLFFAGWACWTLSAAIVLGSAEELSRRLEARQLGAGALALVLPLFGGIFLIVTNNPLPGFGAIMAALLGFVLVYSLALGRLSRRIEELAYPAPERYEAI